MDIADKHPVGGGRRCPPHYLPHKLPVGAKVTDEPCHFHKARWRMAHHRFVCRRLRCPNYSTMLLAADQAAIPDSGEGRPANEAP